jgi:hypothetical protein
MSFSPLNFLRRSSDRGFTFVEILVAVGMLTTLVLAWASFVTQFTRTSKRGRFDFHLSKEHKALTALASTVSRKAILLRQCYLLPGTGPGGALPGELGNIPGVPRMHPYRWIDPVTNQCQSRGDPTDRDANPAPQYIGNTAVFAALLWQWASPAVSGPLRNTTAGTFPQPIGTGTPTLGSFNGALNQNFLVNRIIPAARAAGCMDCHDGTGGADGDDSEPGTPPWITPCNFDNPGAWTGGCAGANVGPLATRNFLTSRLGQLFLPIGAAAEANMDALYSPLLINRQGGRQTLALGTNQIRNYIRFQSDTISTVGPATTSQQFVNPGCDCRPAGANCCPAGAGTQEPGSCNFVCRRYVPDSGRCSCGKDCFQACPPECDTGSGGIGGYNSVFRCLRTNGGGTVTSPKTVITTVGINPDPRGPATRVLSSAVVPP